MVFPVWVGKRGSYCKHVVEGIESRGLLWDLSRSIERDIKLRSKVNFLNVTLFSIFYSVSTLTVNEKVDLKTSFYRPKKFGPLLF